MIDINKVPIFTQEVFHFTLPNFEEWKKHINQIILVEENKNIHKHDTLPKEACNVMAKRTAWNSHQRYPALDILCNEIKKHLKEFIKKENYDVPSLEIADCWINWYKKNQYAQPHKHGSALSVAHTNFSNIKELTVKDGTVLIFDGSVSHSVSSNLTDNTRVTVAMNFKADYKKNRNEY